jgi:hypothetical protein
MNSRMRSLAIAFAVATAAGQSGCDSTPADPYKDMQMLTPVQAGVKEPDQDPVLEAEQAHNAKFAHKKPRAR